MKRAFTPVAAFVLAMTAASAAAQTTFEPTSAVPRVVRVDGVVASSGPSTELVTLALFDAETGGTLLWEETQEVSVDASGRYAVFVGATRAEGLPVGVLSGGGPRWLSIRFVRNGEVEAARVPLTSVPYALKASDADTLGGLPASAFLRSAKADDMAPGASRGASAPSSRVDPAVNSGTPNFIGKFVDSIDLTSSVIYEAGGRIGVGTGAATPLDVVHSKFTSTDGSLTGLAVQNMGATATSYSGMLFYDHNGALGQFQGFNNITKEYRINNIAPGGTINFMLGSTSRFLVGSSGDITIAGNLRKGASPFLHNNGTRNLGIGIDGLAAVTTGTDNVAVGPTALAALSTGAAAGGRNIAIGASALDVNNNDENTAVGHASFKSSPGAANTGLGAFAGSGQTAGDFNMYLGYYVGRDINENNTMRIGDSGFYSKTFIGAIRSTTTGVANAVAVVVDSNGQLGTISSSRRFKDDIRDMGDASGGLMKLRPVTYRYTKPYADGSRPIDYGLIAEEVAEVYPDIVARTADGEIETVQYHKVNAMLLNEVQKQHREIEAQRGKIEALMERLAALERQLASEKR